jgi:hypothetical protein
MDSYLFDQTRKGTLQMAKSKKETISKNMPNLWPINVFYSVIHSQTDKSKNMKFDELVNCKTNGTTKINK